MKGRIVPPNTAINYKASKDVEQITKADRHACHALGRISKVYATLRQLSSTVLRLLEGAEIVKRCVY